MANKFNKICLLAALGAFGLTACDEIIAKPSDYDKQVIKTDDDIYNNIMNIVYDSIREGTLASDVLDKVLYQYSVSVFGRYNKFASPKGENNSLAKEVTLQQAYASAVSDDKTVAKEFIANHKAYWSTDADGNRLEGKEEEELARLTAKWDSIEERIAEKLHASISTGGYSYRNLFSEKQFLVSLRTSLKKVASQAYIDEALENNGRICEDEIISPDYEEKDVFKHYLYRSFYQGYFFENDEWKETPNTYVEDEIIPEIYRTLLTEQYLLDETYNTLGRSYARKVNILSITNNDEYNKAAPYLMNYFVDNYINKPGQDVTLETFKAVSNAWKGADIIADSIEETLLKESGGFTYDSTNDYYKGTEYGDVMDDYAKICSDPLLTDSSIESEFTNNGAYTIETGLELKQREISLKDHVTNGWYIKNGGLSEFSTFKDRLFNIGVSNALDSDKVQDRFQEDKDNQGVYTYNVANDNNNYVAKINGKYYLKASSTEQGQEANDILFYNADSKTYYIVQIDEAVSSTKLSKDSSKNYAAIRDDEKVMEDIVNDVVEVVADNDSYETLAKKHWLEEMELKYHDEVVYDYFKSNFPELFEDD